VKPERRVMHGVQLASGVWVVNQHLTAHHPEQADAERVVVRDTALTWARTQRTSSASTGGAPVVLGGDFNRRKAAVPGFTEAAHHDVDHIFVHGLEPVGRFEVLDRGTLSDHAPIRAELR